MSLDLTMPVLVVDDYRTMARIMRMLLQKVGFQHVDESTDGADALAKMKERKYGLVISDWNMAPTTGYELLQQAKADEGLRETPFLMVSADLDPENVVAARKAGASGYVVKPFDAQILKARIESLFRAA